MRCPICGAADSRVLDSRPTDDGKSIKRRRECHACARRFNTYEMVDNVPVSVIKKDGSREFFDKHKLHAGLLKACQKRPVDTGAIADDIEAELANSLTSEISSREIGEMVMKRLRAADQISYVRFASVYREFTDLTAFIDELQSMVKSAKPRGRKPSKEKKE